MIELLDQSYLAFQIWMQKQKEVAGEQWKQFKNDESGVSSIVATVILILIVVLLAVIFWNSIKTFLAQLFDRITKQGTGMGSEVTSTTTFNDV